MIKDGVAITPSESEDILVGITRNTMITLLENELGVKVIERSIDRGEVYGADEVFLVGTGAEVTPVIEVDKRPVADGKVGPITTKIKDIYFKLVHGEYGKYEEFLTKVTR
jgi:branched-chain amino acid aminotransferase